MANKMNTELGLDLTPFEKSLVRLQKRLGELSRDLQGIGQTMTQNLTLPIVAAGAASIKAFADMEKLNKGLIAIMGSGELAAEELTKLREVAKLPGLGLKEAVQGSINLQAVGLSADEARDTLFGFGKALAATGKGKVELEAIQYQLTQMISKNKLLAEDYKVIQSNLPLMAKGMELAFGTNNIEAIRETGISAKEFTMRLSEALAKLPETQNVTGGLANAFENFGDNVFVAASELGKIIAETLNLEGVLTKLSDGLAAVVGWFKQLNPGAQKFVIILGAILAGIGPVLFIAAKLVGLFATLSSGFRVLVGLGSKLGAVFAALTSPISLIVLAILGAIAAVAALYNKFEGVRRVVNGVGQSFIEFAKLAKNSFSALFEGFARLKEGDFKGAATQFGKALQVLNPVEQGRALAVGFANGFEDTTNYLEPTVQKIKEQVQSAQKSLFGGTAPTPTALPGGGGGGGKNINETIQQSREVFNVEPLTRYRQEITLTANELEKYGTTLASAQLNSSLASEQTNARLADTRTILNQVAAAANSTRAYFEQMDVAALAAVEEKLKRAKEALDNFNTSASQIVEGALQGLAVGFGEFLGKIADAPLTLRGLIGTILIPIADALINLGKLAVATGIAVEGIKKALQTLNPIAAIVGGVALIALGSFVKSKAANLTKLAKGGLAFGPTTAIVGDNPAARTDPEVIAPLSKLKDYLNPGGGAMIAEARISGNDLLILVNNAERANNRIR